MKILIAVDDSPFSHRLVNSILKSQWQINTTFKVLTVIEPLCISSSENSDAKLNESINKINAHRINTAKKFCETLCHQIKEKIESCKVSYEIKEGSARSEIINAAIDWDADKILVGAHRRDVCPHNLLGSVSRYVVNNAPCSVEVVRAQESKKVLSK